MARSSVIGEWDDATGALKYLMRPDGSARAPAGGGVGASGYQLPIAGQIKTGCVRRELEPYAAGVPFVVFDTASDGTTTARVPSGPGVVSSIYIISSNYTGLRTAVINVYIDGEVTPGMSFQVHNLGNYGQVPQPNGISYLGNTRIQIGIGATAGVNFVRFKYPIPYKTSCRIEIVPTTTDGNYWSNVIYHSGATLPWKLRCNQIPDSARITLTPAQQASRAVNFLRLLPGSGSGVIAGFSMTQFYTNGDNSPLENNIVVYQGDQPWDGSTDPLFNSSGTEDFFGSMFYFNEGPGKFYPDKFVQVDPTLPHTAYPNLAMVQDFLDHVGGIAFSDGVFMTMERGRAANPGTSNRNVDLFYATWYYVPNP